MTSRVRLVLLVLAGLSCLPLAAGAATLVDTVRLDRALDVACSSRDLTPYPERHPLLPRGNVVLHITNEGPAASLRVCLFDAAGLKRADMDLRFAQEETRTVTLEAPPGVYKVRHEIGPERGLSGWGTSVVPTVACLSGAADTNLRFHLGEDVGAGIGSSGGGCVPGSFVVGLAGVVASGGGLLVARTPSLGVLLLYSRLARPKLLDSTLRAKMHAHVAAEPGIHTRELIRALGAGEGQSAYHLGVLAREKVLVSVALRHKRHWFVNGTFAPDEMRAIATLRDPTRRRLYEVVRASPGVALQHAAASAGITPPQASRAVRILERAGLVERRTEGRTLTLHPGRPGEGMRGAPLPESSTARA